MDKQEFSVFASALRTYYPKEGILPNNEAMTLWFKSLEDIPYQTASAMLGKWAALNKWSPSIAEIREQCMALTEEPRRDWSEGWADVLLAVGKYGWCREHEALASLDGLTAAACRRMGWQNICRSENLSVERASFRTIYETMEKRQHEDAMLPPGLKNMIAGIGIKELAEKTG